MAFWLANSRDGQQSDFIQRFDPRFWTVNFPRPEMASVITTAADALRVDLEFYRENALAGLIWESKDRFDHPLLSYDTDVDYSRTTLQFRWQSSGVLPLDAVNGPTLTIEGRDTQGQPRTWYIRLWNYADGAPDNALITLPFSNLLDGWEIGSGSEAIDPTDIDRMFISITPPGYNSASSALLSQRVNGWIELSQINCDGDRPLLPIGDVLTPIHNLQMATAFDDSYNQTPERLLRNIRGLGYRGEILHYLGMSHYYRLTPAPVPADTLTVDDQEAMCAPCRAWHANFLSQCLAGGYQPILSLSYELFDENCPSAWKQRHFDGSSAQTGWVPPSSLLSPANTAAMDYLKMVGADFAAMMAAEGLPIIFQIGEPWWWLSPDRRICLYDDASAAHFLSVLGSPPPEIPDLAGALSAPQLALLDEAGNLLGQSVIALRDHIRAATSPATQVLILLFTPTILDPDMPEAHRANIPNQWAYPAFDRLQLEDYDWLTSGAEALRHRAYEAMDALLQYPAAQQDYLTGFVLLAEDAPTYWGRIDAAADEAAARGITRRFVWALPQVTRDGFTRLPFSGDDDMQAFDDLLYPLALGRDAGVSPEFSTSVTLTASGHERRNSHWSDARLRFDVGPGVRSEEELGTLISFFRARRGAARGFRLVDPFDFSSNDMVGVPTPLDQRLGSGDGLKASFPLSKAYGLGDDPQIRPITRARADSVRVSVGGLEVGNWTLQDGGTIVFDTAPAPDADLRAGFIFDVPVRFAEDRLDITGAAFAAGEAPSVPLIEIREAV